MIARIELHPASDVPALLPELVEVYAAAFAQPPHHEGDAEVARFGDGQLPAHTGRNDFALAVAHEADRVAGFGYGYTGERGQYWSDLLLRSVPTEVADAWVGGHWEIVTLAVHPTAQGRGIGERLMTALQTAAPRDRLLLGGPRVDSPARRLYLRLRWSPLADFGDTTLFGLRQSGPAHLSPASDGRASASGGCGVMGADPPESASTGEGQG